MVSDREAFIDSPSPDLIEIHVSQAFQNGLVPAPWFSSIYSVAHYIPKLNLPQAKKTC